MTNRSGSSRILRWLWVTDPWQTLDHDQDTSLRLAREAEAHGVESHWCDARTIRLCADRRVRVDAARLGEGPPHLGDLPADRAKPAFFHDFNQVHFRVDPPVDLKYLHPLQILRVAGLSAGARHRAPEWVNPLGLLALASEKMESLLLLPPAWSPRMVVSSRREDLLDFGGHEKKAVLKPLHTAQSKGVTLVEFGRPAARKRSLELLARFTEKFTRPVVLQEFLPGIQRAGETRLWFADGKLIAQVQKKPISGDYRIDMDHGSTLSPVSDRNLLRKSDAAARAISPHLRQIGARLAAIDLIDGKVTDFNITSPGLLVGMEKTLGLNLARPVVRSLLS